MAAAEKDRRGYFVYWKAALSVCAHGLSHARCWRAAGHSRSLPGRRDLLLVSLFLVSAGIHTAPLINMFCRLHWVGDNPGANFIGFIAGSTCLVFVFWVSFALIAPIPFSLTTISRSVIGATRSHARSVREFLLMVSRHRTPQINDGAAEGISCRLLKCT